MSKRNLLVKNVLGENPYPNARHWFKTEFKVSQLEGRFYLVSRYARLDIGEPVFIIDRRMLSPDLRRMLDWANSNRRSVYMAGVCETIQNEVPDDKAKIASISDGEKIIPVSFHVSLV